jgi:hypothetical protein
LKPRISSDCRYIGGAAGVLRLNVSERRPGGKYDLKWMCFF